MRERIKGRRPVQARRATNGWPRLRLEALEARVALNAVTRLLPDSAGGRFGAAVAVQPGLTVVGAPDETAGAAASGAVYVYGTAGATWRLTAGDGAAYDDFGRSVAVHGNVIVVGAPGHDAVGFTAGAAYVFRFNGSDWVEETKLLPPSPQWVEYGTAVAVSGDRLLVGCPRQYTGGTFTYTGRGFFYRHEAGAWAADGVFGSGGDGATAGDGFGRAVTLDGATAAVGGTNQVRLYTHSGTAWQAAGVLSSLGGSAVRVSGDVMVVGNPAGVTNGKTTGSAGVFLRTGSNWQQTATLVPASSQSGAKFGAAVAVAGDRIVVGAPESDTPLDRAQAGEAYQYRFNGSSWAVEARRYRTDSAAGDRFGSAVAVAGGAVVIGAPERDDVGAASGAAFVYHLAPPRVAGVVVNDGAAQRSRVTSATVYFDQPVNFAVTPASAFQLSRQADGATATLAATVEPGPTGTSVRLTFTGGASEAVSLLDGRYTLTVLSSGLAAPGLDGNGDGVAGDNFVLVGTPGNGLFRLAGDADGDGDVDATDFGAFRVAFGTAEATFDFDGDGDVDAADFGQFRQRFGASA